ncbi:PilZ domain-containing protein [Oceanisphaera pacifica]|uniref:Cyclic diguanosine monophosphate-binding protein n=1 Tax=Oceanisphaera pacifica TaxID=2818389 RepID=A0ABS3NDH9_9GAMM|nr:PilZ domain-containing protein [Oceanisphaera pacifica]MBO1518341.1 PilZ domain-containing protein [Oceanisphaera pacifica]
MPDRRVFTRINFNTPAWLVTHDGQQFATQVQDISLHGALVSVNEPWPNITGEQIELRLSLDGQDENIIMLTQQRYHQTGFIGLECQRLDINSAGHLRRLVELNLGDEVLLQRQFEELLDQ